MELALVIGSYFTGVITIIAGSVVWFVYSSQKRDKKINSARIILSEIRNAEKRLDEIKDLLDREQKDFPAIMPVNNWNRYSYLFASDFDSYQIEEINNFYNNCQVIEDAAKRDAGYLWLNADAAMQAVQHKYIDLVNDSLTKEGKIDEEKLKEIKSNVLDYYGQNPYLYVPKKTISTMKNYVNKVEKITVSTTGTKLKMLAHETDKKDLK